MLPGLDRRVDFPFRTLKLSLEVHLSRSKSVPLASKGSVPEQVQEETDGNWLTQVRLENDR